MAPSQTMLCSSPKWHMKYNSLDLVLGVEEVEVGGQNTCFNVQSTQYMVQFFVNFLQYIYVPIGRKFNFT